MGGTLIISHIDADGVISAHLLSKFFQGASVYFPEWWRFAEPDIIPESAKTYGTICIADLGTSKALLDKLVELSANSEVYFFDHHQPEDIPPDKIMEYSSPSLKVFWSDKNCAAGLIYEYGLREELIDEKDEWSHAWAGIAVMADGFEDKEGGMRVIERCRSIVPWVFWNVAYRTRYGEDSYPFGAMISAYINAARRLAYHKGAYIALSACRQIESAGVSIIRNIIPTGDELTNYMMEAEYPDLALLSRWYEMWLEKRRDIFERTNITTFTFDSFGVSIINHPWDIGGYVAVSKARDRPHFCINYGVPHERYASISGRQGNKIKLNLAEVMKVAKELSGGAINGGGHIDACGGLVDRGLKVEDVILLLEEAVKTVGEE